MFRAILWVVFVAFSVLSAVAMWKVGYLGIWMSFNDSWGSTQVFVDLVIACSLIMAWIWRDAREKGRSPWPYLVITLAAGSFGPLLYLLLAPATKRAGTPAHAVVH
jgi:dipeptide/tripeptide permease